MNNKELREETELKEQIVGLISQSCACGEIALWCSLHQPNTLEKVKKIFNDSLKSELVGRLEERIRKCGEFTHENGGEIMAFDECIRIVSEL